MKAMIDEKGCLHVSPENALEEFAIRQWWKGWDKSTGTQTCSLHIELSHKYPAPIHVSRTLDKGTETK